ncbi:MAG: CBS domain-containing protein, partial [Rhizobiales bacterium]|nr:CBS domain-containing protein [Hyphomicrobiales bacterium]
MAELAANTPLIGLEVVAIDTETTGLDPKTARIVQIGATMTDGTSEPFDELVNPEGPIPPASTVIHGISDGDVENAPRYRDLAGRLEEYCAGKVLLGHNISFDVAVIDAENHRAGREAAAPRTLDTILLARVAFPNLVDYSIESLASKLVVPITARHTALGDAETTAAIFKAMMPALAERGVRTLGEAERASHAVAEDMIARSEPGYYPHAAKDTARSPISPAAAQIDSFPYCHRVSDVMSSNPLTVDASTSVAETARQLTERRTSSAFISDMPESGGNGIVTERDLMRALASGPQAAAEPVHKIASHPLICVRETAFVYRAIALMDRHDIRHLGVIDEAGALVGALTTGDLLRQRAQAALVMGDEIDHAPDAAALAKAWSQLPTVVRSML